MGSLESCTSIAGVGGTLQVDVVVQGIAPYDPGTESGGIIGFQFNLLYDPSVLQVVDYDERFMLTAAGDSFFVTFSDSAPDSDGDFLSAAAVLGGTDHESGDGILTRITLEAVGVGTSVLQLTETLSGEPMVFDADTSLYPISGVTNGAVVVGGICDPDGDGDGFTDTQELAMGTDPLDDCAGTPTADDEGLQDAWPFDFNDDQRAALGDVLGFIPVFNTFAPGLPYDPRWDLDASGGITLGDVLSYIPVFNMSCAP